MRYSDMVPMLPRYAPEGKSPTMRTLYEIVESAKDGQMPTHDECYWAMLALSALDHFDNRALRKLIDTSPEAKRQAEESFKRVKAALDKDPKEWVGWSNDPTNPEYQKMRKSALALAEKIINRMDKSGGRD